MDKLIDAHNAGEISFDQLVSESEVLLVAGSETTATLMSGNAIVPSRIVQTLMLVWS